MHTNQHQIPQHKLSTLTESRVYENKHFDAKEGRGTEREERGERREERGERERGREEKEERRTGGKLST